MTTTCMLSCQTALQNLYLGGLTHLHSRKPSHTDRHFVSTASCVKTALALPNKKLECHEIETIISSAYETWAIFSRREFLIVLDLLHLKMEVTVSEPCDVIRVYKTSMAIEKVQVWKLLRETSYKSNKTVLHPYFCLFPTFYQWVIC